jgi:hypothetical protein
MSAPNAKLATLLMFILLMASGCQPLMVNSLRDRIRPSNDRDWSPELSVLPTTEFDGNQIHIRNIRNCNYLSDENYVVNHYDKTVRLDDIQSVDFIVVPFKSAPSLAHTMFSFGMRDGSYLGVSVEVRKEKNEEYKPLLGMGNQYEIMYVVADERDLIRLRTRHRDDDVYVYPTVATAQQSQELFANVMRRVNNLAGQPEFYHSVSNNCTTNLAEHVNSLQAKKVPLSWKVLLPGFSAKYAYDLGLLDNRIPFEDLQLISNVNELAERNFDSPQFSQAIRTGRSKIGRTIALENQRQSRTASGSGLRALEQWR